MKNWKEDLKKAQYTPQGSGPVVDGYDAEKIALLAYSSGLEMGINMITNYIKEEMDNPSSTLLPLDLPQKVDKHLQEIFNEIRYGTAPNDPNLN
jgi:hypothetical protein